MKNKIIFPVILILVFLLGGFLVWFLTPKKSFTQKNRYEWVQIINQLEPGLCPQDLTVKIPEDRLVKQYPVSGGWLTVVVCRSYAYQESFAVVYSDKQENHQLLTFTTYLTPTEKMENKMPVDLQFDPKRQIFTTFAKGRGAADCGGIGEYQWDEKTKSVKLIKFQLQECDQPIVSPWPQVFP